MHIEGLVHMAGSFVCFYFGLSARLAVAALSIALKSASGGRK
jgi:hypothetical protein